MYGDLHGSKIIVTRPAVAANTLIETLLRHGADVTNVPLLAVEPLLDPAQLSQKVQDLPNYDLVICISRNAAEIILPYIDDPSIVNWATIGPATAEYLQQCGALNVLCPLQTPFDSHSLLLELQLRAKILKNQCIMILTGSDGNNLLSEALQQRGARVEVVALYKRTMPRMSATQLQSLWSAATAVDIMVVTCVTSLINLQALAKSAGVNPFGIPLLVVSYRISTYAHARGFVSVYVAKGMSDADIVAALLSWRNNANK